MFYLKRELLRKTVLASSVAICASSTVAQTSTVLEEVTVTAHKRAQSAQDIGIAVSAFGGDELRKLGVENLTELQQFIPNVDLFDSYGSGQPVWVIRGVGLIDFNANNTPAASVYVDEVYQTSVAQGTMGLYDVARIEVLKGPQGGLYGRNTSGGAVQVITERPEIDGETNGHVDLSYGRYNRVEANLAFGTSLTDTSAIRIAGHVVKSDDTYTESASAGKEHGEEDKWSLRGQFAMQVSEGVDILLKLEGGNDQSETPLGRAIGVWDPDAVAGEFAQLFFGAPMEGVPTALLNLFAGDAGPYLCPSVAAGVRDNSGTCLSQNGIAPDSVQGNDIYTVDSDPINKLDNESVAFTGILNADLGSVTLTSITSYTDFTYGQVFDWDAGAGSYGDTKTDSDIESWSQEFRLTSNSDSDISWIVGAVYAADEFTEDRKLFQTDHPSPLAAQWDLNYEQDTNSWAVFGQAEWQFSDSWNLVTAVRYTDETKEYTSAEPTAETDYFLDGGYDEKFSFDVVSGKLGLEWTPTDDALVYTSVSRSFKAGGYFGGYAFNFGPNSTTLDNYDEETVLAYELGVKSSWADNRLRLNGAVFYYDYKDYQGFATEFTGGGVLASPLNNVGDVTIKGAEIDLHWKATEALLFQVGLGVLDGEISKSDKFTADIFTGLNQVSLEGQRLPFFSDFSANLMGRYERTVSDSGLMASFQVDYSYRSEFNTVAAVTTAAEKALFEADGYGLANARLALRSPDGSWEIAAAIRNIADKEYIVISNFDGAGSFFDIYGPPRTWSVEVDYNW